MLTLLSDALRNPAFPEDHVEKVRGELLTGLEMRAHNTRSMASLTFRELAYADGHPYGISNSGYTDTVKAITHADLVDFHARTAGPRQAIIVVVGAVKAEDALAMVQETFGDWENPDQPDPIPPPEAPDIEEVRQQHVAIPGKTQSDIMLGVSGPTRKAPDFQAARVANSILGVFGLMGRLGDNVREKQGLAYYSFSRLTGGIGPGPWYVSSGVSPDNVGKATDSIRDEIRRMVDEPVTDEELAENKDNFKGRLPLTLEVNGGVAATIMNLELYDLGLDYLRNYAAMIDAITVADVQAAARNYLNPDAYALAVSGPGVD
jgi:zinc protease